MSNKMATDGGYIWQRPWFSSVLALGILFISGIRLVGICTQQNGVATAAIAQKASLIMPVTAGLLWFNDNFTWLKLFGIILAIVAIVLTSLPPPQKNINSSSPSQGKTNITFNWKLPLLVLVVSGTSEVIFKYTQANYLQPNENAIFTTCIFAVAAIIGVVWFFYLKVKKQISLAWADVAGGILLGVPNYFSVYLFVRALQTTGFEASVFFPVLNIGVVLTAAAIAALVFKEHFYRQKIAGLILAVMAIALLLLGR